MNRLLLFKNVLFILLTNSLLFGSAACKQEPATPTPAVSAITPQFVTEGDAVTISGDYFDATLANNEVLFNGLPGTILTASTTALSVTVPAGAFARAGLPAAEVLVRVANRTSTQNVLLKSADYPRITQVIPAGGVRVGDKLTLAGKGFLLNLASSEVLFPATNQGILRVNPSSATAMQLQVTVPSGAISGSVWLLTYFDAAKTKYVSETIPLSVNP